MQIIYGILSWQRLPDGIAEMMAALKARGANLRVIVMTGHGDINLAAQALRIGAADFIEKPFDEGMIVGAVEAVLRAA